MAEKKNVIFGTQDLVDMVAKYTKTKVDAKRCVEEVLDAIVSELAQDSKVRLKNVGTLRLGRSEACVAYNPQTRKKIKVPAKKTIRFKASSVAKAKLNA